MPAPYRICECGPRPSWPAVAIVFLSSFKNFNAPCKAAALRLLQQGAAADLVAQLDQALLAAQQVRENESNAHRDCSAGEGPLANAFADQFKLVIAHILHIRDA